MTVHGLQTRHITHRTAFFQAGFPGARGWLLCALLPAGTESIRQVKQIYATLLIHIILQAQQLFLAELYFLADFLVIGFLFKRGWENLSPHTVWKSELSSLVSDFLRICFSLFLNFSIWVICILLEEFSHIRKEYPRAKSRHFPPAPWDPTKF